MKNLIIAPHIDDEVLGCYTILNEGTFVCYLGVEDRSYVTASERVKELEDAASVRKFKWILYENVVNNYKCEEMIGQLETQINEQRPERVFIPHYSYNQDHRAVYDAAMVALRHHDINWFVNKVFVYEQPHTILWPYKNFEPNYFIGLDVADKISAYNLYKSQVRGHRSGDFIEIMARLRGKQANMEYAEAFQCIRYVVKTKVD
jgi:LmbE family N-acetylglucosaminyl deacetylase